MKLGRGLFISGAAAGGSAGTAKIACGGAGKVSSNPGDGVTWTARTSQFGSNSVLGACYAGGQFVIVGSTGKIATSLDGITWTLQADINSTYNFRGVAYNGTNLYVAVGVDSDSGTEIIYSSPTGTTWTQRSIGVNGGCFKVAFGAGIWVTSCVGGAIFTSTDGLTWTPGFFDAVGAQPGRSCLFGNVSGGVFVIGAENGGVFSSTNGTLWTSRTSQFSGDNILAGAFGDGKFVIGGDSGKISTSPDGTTWTARTAVSANNVSTLGFGGGLWMANGSSNLYTISDPTTGSWTSQGNVLGGGDSVSDVASVP